MKPHTLLRSGPALRRDRTRGQAMVEFALVLPIFVLLLVGMMDFGFALYSRMSVINAAREGARAAITAPNPTQIPVLVQSAVTSSANGLAVTTTTTCVAIKTAPPPCTFATATSSKAGDAVRVRVDYAYTPFFPLFFGASFDIGTTVEMVRE